MTSFHARSYLGIRENGCVEKQLKKGPRYVRSYQTLKTVQNIRKYVLERIKNLRFHTNKFNAWVPVCKYKAVLGRVKYIFLIPIVKVTFWYLKKYTNRIGLNSCALLTFLKRMFTYIPFV